MVKLNVNGKTHEVEAADDTPLLWVLREALGLTGTKYGCGIAECGACAVHIDGEAALSCVLRVGAIDADAKIVTIEGLSPKGDHPIQQAWVELDVPQCGYCQPGVIMTASALLAKSPDPSDQEIDDAIFNICRCGTYGRIRDGIRKAAKAKA